MRNVVQRVTLIQAPVRHDDETERCQKESFPL